MFSTKIVEEKLAQINQLNKKLTDAADEIKRLEEIEANGKKVAEKLIAKESELVTQTRFAEETIKDEQKKRAAVEADSAKLREQIDGQKENAASLEKTISQLREKISEQSGEIRKLRSEVDETKAANARDSQTVRLEADRAYEQKFHELQDQIEEKERVIKDLKSKEWESKDVETQRLYKEISALQIKLEARSTAANDFRKQSLELQLELSNNLEKVRIFMNEFLGFSFFLLTGMSFLRGF